MTNAIDLFNSNENKSLTRRRFLGYFSSLGLSTTLFPGLLWAKNQEAKEQKISKEMIQEAEQLAGLQFTDEERELMVEGVNEYLEKYEKLREVRLDNSVPPALQFNPILPGMTFEKGRKPFKISKAQLDKVPSDLEEVAFWPVTHLAQLIKSRQVSSVELTKMYLERLEKLIPSSSASSH